MTTPTKDDAFRTFVISNSSKSMVAHLTNYGATLTHLLVPDKAGITQDVVMGFDKPEDYAVDGSGNQYFGCTMGRTANRTAKGKLQLGALDVQLSVNNGPNHLHGGVTGWDKQQWQCAGTSADTCTFTLTSPHGDEGYPGIVAASITYHVSDDCTLRLTYHAALTDTQPAGVDSTVINMTHHSYFNLSGGAEPTIADHMLWTAADRYLAVNSDLIPTGLMTNVADVPAMDFHSSPRRIGDWIDQVPGGGGYDHCFALPAADGPSSDRLQRKAAAACCPRTGIVVEMRTTEPGFQLYSSNFVDGTAKCKASTQARQHGEYAYVQRGALCMEACRFPDAVNHPEWRQQVVLQQGETYSQVTEYKLLVGEL